MGHCRFLSSICICLTALILALPTTPGRAAMAGPLPVSVGKGVPGRVVCLVPHATEILVRFGRADRLAGLTRQDLDLNPGLRIKNVGSYHRPDLKAIEALQPDLIIAAPFQAKGLGAGLGNKYPVRVMASSTLAQGFSQMETLGRIFKCEKKAADIIKQNREQLEQIRARWSAQPEFKKKRVAFVLGAPALACPGKGRFQNQLIEAAGGIAPQWGQNRDRVMVTPELWAEFNPDAVIGSNPDKPKIETILNTPPFNRAPAVRSRRIHFFPPALAGQVSTRVGDYARWLAALLYPTLFADPSKAVTPDKVLFSSPLILNLDYVKGASVVNHRVADTIFKTLSIRFKRPQAVLSTFEGFRQGILGAGNTFIPMGASLGHMSTGVGRVKESIRKNLNFPENTFTTLMTGADMDNLALSQKTFKDLQVTALATAGVRGNAMRMSRDRGYYRALGTINIIILTNCRLSSATMARAIITVTEAKSAALLDMDIRSTYTPLGHRATGTGTDNILVVQGEGPRIDYAGGHSKLGELMAGAVHEGVTKAVFMQNQIAGGRDIFQRLAERQLALKEVVRLLAPGAHAGRLVSELRALLSRPYYASFIETALGLSDDHGKGLVKDLACFNDTCARVAARIAQKPCKIIKNHPSLPPVLGKAFGALISGTLQNKDLQHHRTSQL